MPAGAALLNKDTLPPPPTPPHPSLPAWEAGLSQRPWSLAPHRPGAGSQLRRSSPSSEASLPKVDPGLGRQTHPSQIQPRWICSRKSVSWGYDHSCRAHQTQSTFWSRHPRAQDQGARAARHPPGGHWPMCGQDRMLGVVVVQLLSCVRLFETPWTAARQTSLFFTISRSLLKLISVEPQMPSNYLILCLPLLLFPHSFPTSGSFPVSWLFTSGGENTGASASVLPMSIQGWFPLGLTGWISLQAKGLSRVFPNTTVQKHQFFGAQPSLWSNCYIHTWLLEKP